MRQTHLRTLAVLLVCASTGWADGIPTQTPLVYSGVLEDAAGVPITAQQSLQLSLWDDASSSDAAHQRCSPSAQQVTPDAKGQFKLALDPTCLDAIRATPDLWSQLKVGTVTLPRMKLSAVPFALEAQRAQLAARQVISHGAPGAAISLSVNGLWCGPTPTTSSGSMGGYRQVKAACQTACGSPTAHLCTTGEIVNSFTLQLPIPTNGVYWVAGNVAASGGNSIGVDDCVGWTSASPSAHAAHLFYGDGHLGGDVCSTPYELACCD
jgi:hypothetical protein